MGGIVVPEGLKLRVFAKPPSRGTHLPMIWRGCQASCLSVWTVGLDVDIDRIDIARSEQGRDGEFRHVGSIGGELLAMDKALRKLISRGRVLQLFTKGVHARSSPGST